MDPKSLLRSVEVFSGFEDDAIERIASHSQMREYADGEKILDVGQVVEALGVVVSGKVEILRDDLGSPLETLESAQVFGAISLLTGEPALAVVRAKGPCQILHVPQPRLTEEFGRTPLAARPVARLLAQRLAKRDMDLGEQARVDRARAASQVKLDTSSNKQWTNVLVLNLGSSSIKYSLYQGSSETAGGLVERVGLESARIVHNGASGKVTRSIDAPNHEAGLARVFELIVDPAHGPLARLEEINAVGHRVVHGGHKFTESTVVTQGVKDEIKKAAKLAPLHNPLNLLGIEICERLLPVGMPQVCVFDTAFHMTMPEHAYRYAIPKKMADENNLRRYGFHGTSHKYVAQKACAFLRLPEGSLRLVSCHLGNGASVAAINHGRSQDTSMGLTPLEGLVMGTRSGDVDPGLVLHMLGSGMSREEVDALLNKQSGLLGLSGLSSDMRELQNAAEAGHSGALLAIQTFCYRVRKYIGAYAAAMDGIDAIVFTGGIGENAAGIRSRICQGLGFLGVHLDDRSNNKKNDPEAIARGIHADDSAVKVLVVPADEERVIAQETVSALERGGLAAVLEARGDQEIPIGVSAHHVHLSQEHVEALFGEGHQLTPIKDLKQPGHYACEETVDLAGPKGTVKRVRVLGPTRKATQVEISRTEEFKLGFDAPVRGSGDTSGSPGVKLVGTKGTVELEEGVICALRHIHMAPEHALAFGLKDKDTVRVKVAGERSLIFGDVLVRVFPGWALEMHIDTDEANAAEVSPGNIATIESVQKRVG